MVNLFPSRTHRSVAEALGTRAILAELAAILAAHYQTVREDGVALLVEKCLGWGIHSFLAHLASGAYPVPGLDWVALVSVNPDRKVHLMHLLFSVRFDLYSMSQRLFACLVDMPTKGLPPVVEIPHKAFAPRRSIRAVPRGDHVTHRGGSLPYRLEDQGDVRGR